MAHRFVRALDRRAQRVQSVNPHSPVIRRCRLCLRISGHGPRLSPHASGWKRRNRLDRPGQFIHALAYLVQRPSGLVDAARLLASVASILASSAAIWSSRAIIHSFPPSRAEGTGRGE